MAPARTPPAPQRGRRLLRPFRHGGGGSHAFVAWVDSAGEGSATLRILSFDITAKTAPKPAEIGYDLKVPKSSNRRGGVFDLIAVNGTLYVLVTESNTLDSGHHIWTAQRVIAIVPARTKQP